MPCKRVLIVGAGFSGAVAARQLAESGQVAVHVIDQREHIAGNCHTQRDAGTGVMIHTYGPHIFHTDRADVWEYVNRFGRMVPFTNRVKAQINRGVFSLPINLHTINQFFGKTFRPDEARAFVATLADQSIKEPANFEEQALHLIGRDLYEAFFYGYTCKQWGCDPRELPASILKRLPVRFDYNDSYYASFYQGIPEEGYTAIFEKLLDHPAIRLELSTSYYHDMVEAYDHVVFTGPLDEFYGYREGRLGYRTVFWERQQATGDYQGNAVINFPELHHQHTRGHEHKHFAPWETHEKTVVFTEFSRETGAGDVPYYPKRLPEDLRQLDSYVRLARAETKVSFLGRLSTYRYLDMHQVIGEALDTSATWLEALASGQAFPATFAGPAAMGEQ